ncbi:Transcriptional regulator, AraC family [[Actinomadura] parvosata subsp. kistnae]|uniref:AraC family transcriptional regulator n=1 Tax=[Actinomadura] parvosata subsp. kistnae TaxID=1909395 RepID=A0A1V0AC62_9ACTN|nr:AraC family transcriptional regulator [Nonomuraea sp. ATCC 55076]AQZ67749.1 AraC family transcriptional regulator [Nonomuraea sp. ATCC 55076]SPL93951.1 Transcriptional regulator, AraC family [Actinomadura parvosata subsp. kistnae]
MDLLADVLSVSGVRGTLGTRIEAGDSWTLKLDGHPGSAMHAVTSGSAWLTVPDREPLQLTAGDVVLLPPGTPHTLGDAPGAAQDVARTHANGNGPAGLGTPPLHERGGPVGLGTPLAHGESRTLQLGTPPVRTRLVTIHYVCDPAVRTQVLTRLPDLVHVGAEVGAACFDDAVRMLGRELANPQIATTAVLNSLVDIMLIQLLRAWLATRPPEQRGTWLGMLDDPIVRQALELIHQNPAEQWTTATLASAIAVSRATLSRRFPAAIGQSPAAYLTQWRMDLAAVRLRDTHDSVETIAATVGYGSVPAFSRAFTRAYGMSPGRYRTHASPGMRQPNDVSPEASPGR